MWLVHNDNNEVMRMSAACIQYTYEINDHRTKRKLVIQMYFGSK